MKERKNSPQKFHFNCRNFLFYFLFFCIPLLPLFTDLPTALAEDNRVWFSTFSDPQHNYTPTVDGQTVVYSQPTLYVGEVNQNLSPPPNDIEQRIYLSPMRNNVDFGPTVTGLGDITQVRNRIPGSGSDRMILATSHVDYGLDGYRVVGIAPYLTGAQDEGQASTVTNAGFVGLTNGISSLTHFANGEEYVYVTTKINSLNDGSVYRLNNDGQQPLWFLTGLEYSDVAVRTQFVDNANPSNSRNAWMLLSSSNGITKFDLNEHGLPLNYTSTPLDVGNLELPTGYNTLTTTGSFRSITYDWKTDVLYAATSSQIFSFDFKTGPNPTQVLFAEAIAGTIYQRIAWMENDAINDDGTEIGNFLLPGQKGIGAVRNVLSTESNPPFGFISFYPIIQQTTVLEVAGSPINRVYNHNWPFAHFKD